MQTAACSGRNVLIRLAEQTISVDELQELALWIQQNPKLTKGPLTEAFEAAFSQWIGSKHALFVNSGSSANLVIAHALKESGRLKNNRVILPAVSWVTTVTPFLQLGFEVQLCDCDPLNLGLDVQALEVQIQQFDPGLVVMVDVLGHANAMHEIQALCREHGALLMEDACEALGSECGDVKLGRFGIAGSFSFYYGHHISTIEGGMVVTDDTDLWHVMKSIRSHGWARDVSPAVSKMWREQSKVDTDPFRELYTFYFSGFNLRSTDLQAFIGVSQLKKLPEIIRARADNFSQYALQLPGFFRQHSSTDVLSSFAYGTLVTDPEQVGRALSDGGIESRPLICGNIGRHPFWVTRFGETRMPNADRVHDHGIYLPNHHLLSKSDIGKVCEIMDMSAVPFAADNVSLIRG
jgi:CDP-4-dehydro-6-deoxyglucose reductase, E1